MPKSRTETPKSTNASNKNRRAINVSMAGGGKTGKVQVFNEIKTRPAPFQKALLFAEPHNDFIVVREHGVKDEAMGLGRVQTGAPSSFIWLKDCKSQRFDGDRSEVKKGQGSDSPWGRNNGAVKLSAVGQKTATGRAESESTHHQAALAAASISAGRTTESIFSRILI
jgi:hypothetical protein